MTGAQRIASTPAPVDWQAAYGRLLSKQAKLRKQIEKQARQIATLRKQVQKAEEK